ncbi:MAG: hypothetical protein J5I93_09000 [Pirellulaceae bacterium]|nr:hypothetical protein [Pirellulaceae bacterium]
MARRRGELRAKSDEAYEFTVDRPEGAVRLWTQIVQGLRQAGYAEAGPAYLKLSQLIRAARGEQLLRGAADDTGWSELRELARDAEQMLGPVVEAARLLASLPAPVVQSPPKPNGRRGRKSGSVPK